MSEFAVELNRVTKTFGNQVAVDSIDLRVPQGSIFGFIGPNGSGKTTTMRMILRIYQPDSGTVRVLGNDVGVAADDRVGYLPEERGLYRRMTVRRVLRYFAKLKGLKSPDSEIDQWLERLGCAEWYKKRIDQLSKGMAQKIQFIAAVVAKPELLILDEPFSGLDPVNMETLRDAVLELRKSGTTLIFSTHDMAMAEQLCDRVFMIFRGKKVLDDSLAAIKQNHGIPTLKVRLSNATPSSMNLPGIVSRTTKGDSEHWVLDETANKRQILEALMQQGEVEHFELVQPSLHDIFVRIAKPSEEEHWQNSTSTTPL